MERRQEDAEKMNAVGDELVKKLDEFNGESDGAQREKQATSDRYDRVKERLQNQEMLLAAQINAADKFNKDLQDVQQDIDRVDAALFDEPVGNDPEALKRQLNDLQVSDYYKITTILRAV